MLLKMVSKIHREMTTCKGKMKLIFSSPLNPKEKHCIYKCNSCDYKLDTIETYK